MNFNNLSIRTKLILLLSLSAMIALSISMIASSYSVLNSQKDESLKSLTQLAQISSENITASLLFDDVTSASNILKPLSINVNITMALLYGEDGTLFASYLSKDLKKTHKIQKTLQDKPTVITHFIDWDLMIVTVPVILDENIIGHLQIISDTNQLKQKVIDQLVMMTFIGFISLFIIVLLAFKLHKIFTKPIFNLIEIMDKVSKNNEYDVVVHCKNNDEFKHLYSGFKDMLQKIDIQNKKIDAIHQQTRDSIEYSAGIQTALLPIKENIYTFFDDSFTLWEPKDTVGGDIYLFETLRHKDEALLMVIDCTGHGVPGAFVTMIVKAIEKEIVAKLIKSDYEINPAVIMQYFNKNMKKLLRQDDKDSKLNAGFDGGIIYINKREKILRFAGSQTPLFVVQDNTLKVIKGDKQSVGYKKSDVAYKYTQHEIDLCKATSIYLTSDGYLDQTGGEKGFLFGKKRFGKLVESLYTLPFSEQLEKFKETFCTYKRTQETKDDTTLVGFYLNLGDSHDSK
ncbi:SpoIIE family protein phosphatase [Sulfurimonas sp. SAG-AH-194-I05]|nr:SpoIIE family protein phosphatase [Sulfurimonas sp. SAG-AH-194-I05]MDF1875501.1 SpoIIE family protein phosphatase [Sulfurimonas sp. SAG-AH-194-I05]